MGLSRNGMNLEVAKNENSVILLENNYKETYEGFNPKNPESLIGLTLLQEENLNSSINLAIKIQNNFTNNLERNSRGVKQQPLWVLDAVFMPGVLIELGFLSNKEEGTFLNSEEGQNKMALEIANAINSYKTDYFGEQINSSKKHNATENVAIITKTNDEAMPLLVSTDTFYKVQLFATSKKIQLDSKQFKGLQNVSRTFSNKIYRYTYGKTVNINDANKMKLAAKKLGFIDAFIVAVNDGKSTTVNEVATHNN